MRIITRDQQRKLQARHERQPSWPPSALDDRFFDGTFPGEYQQMLLDEFNEYLPQDPPWPVE